MKRLTLCVYLVGTLIAPLQASAGGKDRVAVKTRTVQIRPYADRYGEYYSVQAPRQVKRALARELHATFKQVPREQWQHIEVTPFFGSERTGFSSMLSSMMAPKPRTVVQKITGEHNPHRPELAAAMLSDKGRADIRHAHGFKPEAPRTVSAKGHKDIDSFLGALDAEISRYVKANETALEYRFVDGFKVKRPRRKWDGWKEFWEPFATGL